MKKREMMIENVVSTVAKMLMLKDMRKQFRKAEDLTADDQKLQDRLRAVHQKVRDLDEDLSSFCKEHPRSVLCDEGQVEKKATVRRVKGSD
jgi:uncharacterized protein YlxW (UPF0749 family)